MLSKEAILALAMPLIESLVGMTKGVREKFFTELGQKLRQNIATSSNKIDDKILEEVLTTDIPALLSGLTGQKQ